MDTIELLQIGDVILELIDDRAFESLPRGDLQAIIEAQILKAYQLGKQIK